MTITTMTFTTENAAKNGASQMAVAGYLVRKTYFRKTGKQLDPNGEWVSDGVWVVEYTSKRLEPSDVENKCECGASIGRNNMKCKSCTALERHARAKAMKESRGHLTVIK